MLLESRHAQVVSRQFHYILNACFPQLVETRPETF